MSDKTALISGIPAVGTPSESKSDGKTTAALLVQQATYNLSKAIFNFSPPTFQLDNAIEYWKSKDFKNFDGQIPETHALETRVGASLALLGYLEKSQVAGLTTVVAASGTLKVMEPVLSQHVQSIKHQPVVFDVAGVDYDGVSNLLEPQYTAVGRVSRNLGLPLVISTLAGALQGDAYNTSVLAAVIAKSLGPTVHLYDGIRGSRQAFTKPSLKLTEKFSELPKVSSVVEAFAATNKILGTSFAPFEYHGAVEPKTVYVTLGSAKVLALADKESIGVVNVRLYSPFLGDDFLSTVPASAVQIVVVCDDSKDLYKDVNAAVRMHYGFRAGPIVTAALPESISAVISATGANVIVWDGDSAATAVAPARLAAPRSDVSCYTVFDNCVAGGAVASEVRFGFGKQFWDIEKSDITMVISSDILKSVDVTAGLKHQGKLVIAASSDEEVAKLVPGQLKLNAMAKQLDVYRLDFAKIESAATEGRTSVLATQAAIWLLSGADVDTATSMLVHSNSLDTELIAATVNVIVTTLKESALAQVSKETLQEWTKVELTEKERSTTYALSPSLTSFSGNEGAVADVEEAASTVEQSTGVDTLGLKKRLVFQEAFNTSHELRPDVPAKTVVSKVSVNQRVTPEDYDRHIFKLELDISGTGLTYAIGEALGIHAPNNKQQVLDFLEWYGVNPDDSFAVPASSSVTPGVEAYRTAFQISREHLDLFGKVPKRFYEGLTAFASDKEELAKLNHLLTPGGAEDLKRRSEVDFENYVDVLREFESARPKFPELIDLVAPLKRREYSIASSQKVHPNEVHLLIVVVDWVNSNGEKRYGQCSKFLADLTRGEEVVVSVKPSVLKLPKDPSTPIIMAGLGTGLAPFKAFLEEKMWQRDQGETIGDIYLFLGSRHQRQEYLYGELFEAYKTAGVLTHIGAAFSRDQPEKIYIQDRIKQSKNILADAFVNRGGNFYLCGPTWPVPDISAALTEIVVEGKPEEKINEATLIEELKEAERYVLEVY